MFLTQVKATGHSEAGTVNSTPLLQHRVSSRLLRCLWVQGKVSRAVLPGCSVPGSSMATSGHRAEAMV